MSKIEYSRGARIVKGWTTEGPRRGCCGHDHRTFEAAQRCLEREPRGSDRRVVDAWGQYHDAPHEG